MKKLFTLFFALPLLFVACDENPETPKPTPNEPTLELTSEATMEFDAEGGKGEITYNLIKGDGSLDGELGITGQTSSIVITTEQNWITIIDSESILGTIKFEVAENTAEEQRIGYITGKYSTKSFTVTINQAATVVDTPVAAFEGWAVVGSFTNNWDVKSAICMETIDGYYVARGVEISTEDSFKFAKDGTMQNSLGGNGQPAERDYKYPIAKYGSDIRVAEAGVYDLYLNEATDAYYVMSEGKTPAEANEEIAQGKDIWYVKSLGESVQLRKSGIFLSATSVQLSKEGFTLYYSLTDTTYGVVDAAVVEVGTEIAIAETENAIKANVEEGKLYDIYFLVEESKLWVMPRGGKPVVMSICNYAEGVWFDSKNFLLYLEAEGVRLTLDLNSAVASENAIIPAATYTVDGEDGNVINAPLCEIASNDGKSPVVSGSVTISHIDGGYDILIDVVNIQQHRTLASYSGPIKSNPYMGGPITNPEK